MAVVRAPCARLRQPAPCAAARPRTHTPARLACPRCRAGERPAGAACGAAGSKPCICTGEGETKKHGDEKEKFLSEKRAELIVDAKIEKAEEEEATFKFCCVLGLLALTATFIGGFLLELSHIHRLPEAGVGLTFGFLLSLGANYFHNEEMLAAEQFDFEFFMIWLLPPIIFEAGFNMNASAFFENLGPTIFFAFIGTFASTFVVGGIVYYLGQMGWCYPLGLLASLVFGSLISATDPVTVLAVFQKLGVKVDLFSMVFGESVLNDAVAIVLSRTLLSFNVPGAEVNQESIMAAVVSFLSLSSRRFLCFLLAATVVVVVVVDAVEQVCVSYA